MAMFSLHSSFDTTGLSKQVQSSYSLPSLALDSLRLLCSESLCCLAATVESRSYFLEKRRDDRNIIAFQKHDGSDTYIQHSLATIHDSMPRANALGNYNHITYITSISCPSHNIGMYKFWWVQDLHYLMLVMILMIKITEKHECVRWIEKKGSSSPHCHWNLPFACEISIGLNKQIFAYKTNIRLSVIKTHATIFRGVPSVSFYKFPPIFCSSLG